MRAICFYFQVHQPVRLRRYRFFEIGNNNYYYDDFANSNILNKVANKCYIPTNNLLYELINTYGTNFKVSFSISGTALDQFERFAPEVLESFKKLVKTGCVELLAETYAHSLCSIKSKDEFKRQVLMHKNKIEELFGVKPKVFRNTELIYSDHIGQMVYDMGFKGMLTEGAKHILGWKSPNYLYCNAFEPRLKLLLKNYQLSDDIAFRFSNRGWSEWPLTTEKYVAWLNAIDPKQEIVNLFMDYETFGEHQWADTGIFEFLRHLPKTVFANSNYKFITPCEAIEMLEPVAPIHVPYPISWADEERDLTAWLGNELQEDAFNALYELEENIKNIDDKEIQKNWLYLQTSDHFYYMCTKWFSDGDVHKYFNHYDTPYEAYINYMNVLSDFKLRVHKITGEEVKITKPKKATKKESVFKPSIIAQPDVKIIYPEIIEAKDTSQKKIEEKSITITDKTDQVGKKVKKKSKTLKNKKDVKLIKEKNKISSEKKKTEKNSTKNKTKKTESNKKTTKTKKQK